MRSTAAFGDDHRAPCGPTAAGGDDRGRRRGDARIERLPAALAFSSGVSVAGISARTPVGSVTDRFRTNLAPSDFTCSGSRYGRHSASTTDARRLAVAMACSPAHAGADVPPATGRMVPAAVV
jgi:hypothetical protein